MSILTTSLVCALALISNVNCALPNSDPPAPISELHSPAPSQQPSSASFQQPLSESDRRPPGSSQLPLSESGRQPFPGSDQQTPSSELQLQPSPPLTPSPIPSLVSIGQKIDPNGNLPATIRYAFARYCQGTTDAGKRKELYELILRMGVIYSIRASELRARAKIIGALDVQPERSNAQTIIADDIVNLLEELDRLRHAIEARRPPKDLVLEKVSFVCIFRNKLVSMVNDEINGVDIAALTKDLAPLETPKADATSDVQVMQDQVMKELSDDVYSLCAHMLGLSADIFSTEKPLSVDMDALDERNDSLHILILVAYQFCFRSFGDASIYRLRKLVEAATSTIAFSFLKLQQTFSVLMRYQAKVGEIGLTREIKMSLVKAVIWSDTAAFLSRVKSAMGEVSRAKWPTELKLTIQAVSNVYDNVSFKDSLIRFLEDEIMFQQMRTLGEINTALKSGKALDFLEQYKSETRKKTLCLYQRLSQHACTIGRVYPELSGACRLILHQHAVLQDQWQEQYRMRLFIGCRSTLDLCENFPCFIQPLIWQWTRDDAFRLLADYLSARERYLQSLAKFLKLPEMPIELRSESMILSVLQSKVKRLESIKLKQPESLFAVNVSSGRFMVFHMTMANRNAIGLPPPIFYLYEHLLYGNGIPSMTEDDRFNLVRVFRALDNMLLNFMLSMIDKWELLALKRKTIEEVYPEKDYWITTLMKQTAVFEHAAAASDARYKLFSSILGRYVEHTIRTFLAVLDSDHLFIIPKYDTPRSQDPDGTLCLASLTLWPPSTVHDYFQRQGLYIQAIIRLEMTRKSLSKPAPGSVRTVEFLCRHYAMSYAMLTDWNVSDHELDYVYQLQCLSILKLVEEWSSDLPGSRLFVHSGAFQPRDDPDS